MKNSWGYGIVAVYATFVCGMLYLVLQSSRQKVDLVTEEYYEQEIRYQERIDRSNRAAKLSDRVRFEAGGGYLAFRFPPEFREAEVKGKALLYCPSDDGKDISIDVSTRTGVYRVPLPADRKGSHTVKLEWQAQGKTYYSEQQLFLH